MGSKRIGIICLAACFVTGCTQGYAALKKRADSFYYTGRYEQAETLYLQAKKLNSQDPELYLHLGEIELKRANVQEAILLLERAKQLDPNNPESHFLLGAAYDVEGRYPQAIPAFEETIRLQPCHVGALDQLATAYHRIGRVEKALQAMSSLASCDQDNKYAYTWIGFLHDELGNYAQAKVALQKAVKINPLYWKNHLELGWLESRLGSSEHAIQFFVRATELNPGDPVSYFSLGQAYFDQGAYQKASEAFAKVLALNPDHRQAKQYKELADRPRQQSSLGKARTPDAAAGEHQLIESTIHAFEALLAGNREAGMSQLGYLYELSNNDGKALEAYRRVVELNPQNAWAQQRLAEVEAKVKFFSGVKDRWAVAPEVETKYFVIKTNLPDELKSVLVQEVDHWFEETQRILKEKTGLSQVEVASKTKLQIFARPEEYSQYLASITATPELHGSYEVGSLNIQRNEIMFLYKPDRDPKILVHEFADVLQFL